MTKETVIKVRKELHNLPGKERGVSLPLRVICGDGNQKFSEASSCFIWDDSNEVLYIVMPNTIPTETCDSRLFPMDIYAIEYESIMFIDAPVDRLCLDNFLKDKVSKGLTNEETRKRYYKDMTDLFDERTYFMGDPSPTTEKRGLRPEDEIVDKNATKFL